MIDYMREYYVQIKNNKKYIFYKTKSDIITFSALLGLLGFFVSFSDVISCIFASKDFLCKISIGFIMVAFVSLSCFVKRAISVLTNR